MPSPVIVRKNRLFCINEKVLPAGANKTPIKAALYAAIHQEFRGASTSERYMKLTPEQRMQKINEFAWKWLNDRGFK